MHTQKSTPFSIFEIQRINFSLSEWVCVCNKNKFLLFAPRISHLKCEIGRQRTRQDEQRRKCLFYCSRELSSEVVECEVELEDDIRYHQSFRCVRGRREHDCSYPWALWENFIFKFIIQCNSYGVLCVVGSLGEFSFLVFHFLSFVCWIFIRNPSNIARTDEIWNLFMKFLLS